GIVLIVAGSNIAVDAATELARTFGLSERIIGLTIVALGTSLPELVTSVLAARKGNVDIAIGNIVGSNIFNILFVVGTSALIIPIPFAQAFVTDFAVAAGAAILLLICCLRKQRLSRLSGALMLICYAAYFAFVLM
ncbi:MAG: sodium:calcium antiporter, partial [Firmicutes bacterium]|nr:sodium:calcium antiporter [Bacillota bacterium]